MSSSDKNKELWIPPSPTVRRLFRPGEIEKLDWNADDALTIDRGHCEVKPVDPSTIGLDEFPPERVHVIHDGFDVKDWWVLDAAYHCLRYKLAKLKSEPPFRRKNGMLRILVEDLSHFSIACLLLLPLFIDRFLALPKVEKLRLELFIWEDLPLKPDEDTNEAPRTNNLGSMFWHTRKIVDAILGSDRSRRAFMIRQFPSKRDAVRARSRAEIDGVVLAPLEKHSIIGSAAAVRNRCMPHLKGKKDEPLLLIYPIHQGTFAFLGKSLKDALPDRPVYALGLVKDSLFQALKNQKNRRHDWLRMLTILSLNGAVSVNRLPQSRGEAGATELVKCLADYRKIVEDIVEKEDIKEIMMLAISDR